MNLEEKALQLTPKALSLGCSIQYRGSVESWSRGMHFSLLTRPMFLGGDNAGGKYP